MSRALAFSPPAMDGPGRSWRWIGEGGGVVVTALGSARSADLSAVVSCSACGPRLPVAGSRASAETENGKRDFWMGEAGENVPLPARDAARRVACDGEYGPSP